MTTTEPARKLNALTSLRFFAAVGIVVMHCGGHFGLPDELTLQRRIPLFLGVSFFFVLSGFILTYVYPSLDSPRACGRFLLARFARVWPCHVLALILYCLVNGITPGSIREQGLVAPYLANLAMVHAWIPTRSFYLAANGPSWSISAEFAFYFLFPLLLWRLDRTWHVKLAACLLLGLAILIACRLGDFPLKTGTGVTIEGLLYMNPLGRLFEFTLGMVTAHFWRSYGPRIRVGVWLGTLVELAAVAVVVASFCGWRPIADWILELTGTPWRFRIISSHWTTCLSFAALIFVAGLGRGWLTRALSWSGFVLLGEISYAFYLLHFPMLGYVHYRKANLEGYPNWAVFAGFLIVVLVLSHLTWHLIEGPARRFLVGLWPKPGAGPASDRPPAAGRPSRTMPNPTRVVLAAELLLVGILIYSLERPPYSIISDSKAFALRAEGRPEARDIRFGGRFLLRDALLAETQAGLEVRLLWQSRRAQPLDCFVAVQLCDPEGRVLKDLSYVQDPLRRAVAEGAIWVERKLIPRDQIEAAGGLGTAKVAVAIGPVSRGPGQDPVYHPESGPRDGGNWRVLLNASERPPFPFLPAKEALMLRAEGRPEARDIRFGGRFLLRDALLAETQAGLEVRLLWQSRRAQPLDCFVAVQLCDPEGRVLKDLSYVQDPLRRAVAEGAIWVERKLIPRDQIEAAGGLGTAKVAVAIGPVSRGPGQDPVYHPESGPRDGGNWRVLLRLAEVARAPGETRTR